MEGSHFEYKDELLLLKTSNYFRDDGSKNFYNMYTNFYIICVSFLPTKGGKGMYDI